MSKTIFKNKLNTTFKFIKNTKKLNIFMISGYKKKTSLSLTHSVNRTITLRAHSSIHDSAKRFDSRIKTNPLLEYATAMKWRLVSSLLSFSWQGHQPVSPITPPVIAKKKKFIRLAFFHMKFCVRCTRFEFNSLMLCQQKFNQMHMMIVL